MLVFGVYCQDGLLPSNLVRVNRFGAPARSLLVSWWTPPSKIVVTRGLPDWKGRMVFRSQSSPTWWTNFLEKLYKCFSCSSRGFCRLPLLYPLVSYLQRSQIGGSWAFGMYIQDLWGVNGHVYNKLLCVHPGRLTWNLKIVVMESKNHPIKKENHLNQTTFFSGSSRLNLPGLIKLEFFWTSSLGDPTGDGAGLRGAPLSCKWLLLFS